ncbi:MAG: hypothetical protein KDJ14_00825 [Xanthomonadales bacterium]|nr:hypothetical protein [Xanthomonadales bacterium]
MHAAALVAAALLSAGCAKTSRPDQPAVTESPIAPAPAVPVGSIEVAPTATTAPAPRRSFWPIDTQSLRTTSADIWIGNLQARIDTLSASKHDPRRAGKLAAALYARYRVLGRIEDAEQALAVLEAVPRAELNGEEQLVLARILSGFHRFGEAEALLKHLPDGALASERAAIGRDIDVALGRYRRLQDDFAVAEQPVNDFYELAHRADLLVLQGKLAPAEQQYRRAQSLYRDVDPMPLAWLHTQMGIALLRFGDIERARTFFAAAVDRLPGYALAEEHLAECETLLGRFDRARARYHRVIEQTGNPEFIAALSGLERTTGHIEEADAWHARARARYASLLKRQPAAFGYHAVEFFIESGDAERALGLARENRKLRGDISSRILLMRAARAAGADQEACWAWQEAAATGLNPPEWSEERGRSPCEED